MTESRILYDQKCPFIFQGFRPPPKLTISQWADEHGVVVHGAEKGGKWKTRPYQVAIMDAYIQPEIEWIIVRKSARIGWTSILGHVIGYHIDQNPCSQLMVQPTIDDASNWSKEDLQPIIRFAKLCQYFVAHCTNNACAWVIIFVDPMPKAHETK